MELPENKRTVTLGKEEINLDTQNLAFNESTLTEFMERLGLNYDYYTTKLAEAEYLKDRFDEQYDEIYSEKYADFKESGATDKLAEARAKNSPEVMAARKQCTEAKFRVRQLQNHIKSWDKTHENAQSRGHFLRKEMDKLSNEIYHRNQELARRAEEVIRGET